jgi:hypothetical protein
MLHWQALCGSDSSFIAQNKIMCAYLFVAYAVTECYSGPQIISNIWKDWIDVAQDMGQWWAYVNIVRDLQVSQKIRAFFY